MSDHGRLSVLQVVWRLSDTGGIPQVVRRLVAGLDRGLIDIHVCTARPLASQDAVDDLGPGISFHTLGIEGDRTLRSRMSGSLRLLQLIRNLRPEIVHIHSGVTWLLVPTIVGGFHRKPSIIEVHDSPQSGRVSTANWVVERWLLRRKRSVALVHSKAVESALASAVGAGCPKIWTIPIGLSLAGAGSAADASEWRRRNHISSDELIVTYVGRLVLSKRPEMFVQLASQIGQSVPTAFFVLAGDGPNRKDLEDLARSIAVGDRLLIRGREPDLPGLLAASAIFVSTSEYEGFGMAILEAMAATTAVVATKVGATEELVVPGVNGLLVEPNDPSALVEAVRYLLEHPDVRSRMASEGRRRVEEEYDVSTMVSRYQDLYLAVAPHDRVGSSGT